MTQERSHTSLGRDLRSQETGARSPLRFAFLILITLALAILVILSSGHLVIWSPCYGEEGERFPSFRRVLLSPERVPEELRRVQDGVLVRLPISEFDGLIEKANQLGKRETRPRLSEARYHATLKEQNLIGEGQWKLVHKGTKPSLLRLQPFNLALRQARFENGDALIADFDRNGPSLLVESPGERTVSLDWSARGESGPEGLQFHLEMPACPVSLLELDVPADRIVKVLDDNTLLTGPHAAEADQLRRWQIVCGSRQRTERQLLDFRILAADRVKAETKRSNPLIRQKTMQKLQPDGLDATFELTIEDLPSPRRELVCECDAELRVRDIIGPAVAGWSFRAGAHDKPSLLTIRLRESVRAGTWQVLCLAPLNHASSTGREESIAWRSPGLRLVDGISRGETLTLSLHPDLRVEGWDSGSFRLDLSSVDGSTGGQVLTLVGDGLSPPHRPKVRLHPYAVDFSAHQLTWWRCDGGGMALTLQIGWDVQEGQLFQLPVQLPAGWDVEKVETTPSALLRQWYVRSIAGKATLFADLTRPLTARPKNERERPKETAPLVAAASRARLPTLAIQLRPAFAAPFAEKPLAFPDAVPLGARYRQGALALDCNEQLYRLDVRTSAERADPESDGPWGQQPPDYYYRFRGKPLIGEIRVHPRPPRLRARCESQVFVGSGEAVIETHLILEAEIGSPKQIELWLSSGDGESWDWRNEQSPRGEDATVTRVRRMERVASSVSSNMLHFFAASNPLQAAIIQAAQPAGEHWRLTLTRPLHAREPLRLRARKRLQSFANQWYVPLPIVLGTDRMEGEVKLHLAGTDIVQVESDGLREATPAIDKGSAPWRTFRYGPGEVRLTISGHAIASERPTTASIETARLITYVDAKGSLRHHFSFWVADWNEHTLPLRLPPGSRPIAVQVDGRWLPRIIPAAAGMLTDSATGNERMEPIELALPVPSHSDTGSERRRHRFEVVYARRQPPWSFWQSLEGEGPQLPVAPVAFRRIWRLHPKLTPLFQERYQSLPGTVPPAELAVLPRHADDLFCVFSSLARLDPFQEDQPLRARDALGQAIQDLCSQHAEQTMPLGEIVSETACNYLKDRCNLLIDALALGEAGVGRETLLTIKRPTSDDALPPWTECGLIAIPARSAILLTTTSVRGTVFRGPLSKEVENSLNEAARYGQDSSGRFHSALNWMHSESTSLSTGSRQIRPLEPEYEGAHWSEWEPLAGVPNQQLIVVRRDLVTALGVCLGLLLGFFCWRLRLRSARLRLTLFLLILALTGSGMLWLPTALRDLAWWPFVAVAGIAALRYIRNFRPNRTAAPSTQNQPKSALSVGSALGILFLALGGWNGRAEAPAPSVVYLVPGPADAPDKQSVLVPVDLLNRLKALARPAPRGSAGPQSVLLDVSYEGRLVDGGNQAEFNAVFTAHSLTEESSTLILPLSGVQLADPFLLDGARAAPVALPAPQKGYAVTVRGRGRHKIELSFRVAVEGTEEDRNVLFTPPPLVRSRLSWHIPEGAVEPRVLVKNGAQWTIRDGPDQRLEADLGAVPLPVHLHWFQPRHPLRASYRAAYLWNLGIEASHLTAWLRYRVDQGAMKNLELDLPAELEVSSVIAQRLLAATRPLWLTRFQLNDWYVTHLGKQHTLHLELPYPISGDFQVTLELLPRTPLSSPVSLPLPSPRGLAASDSNYLAYRMRPGLQAVRENTHNLTRIGNKDLPTEWRSELPLDASFRGAAYRIAINQSPQLSLRLHSTPPLVQGDVDISVQTTGQSAEIQVVADVTGPNQDLAAVEWELPPHCSIAAVKGEDVRTWNQNGSRLLVWLNRTRTKTRLYMNGWLTLENRDEHPFLELNGPRLLHADKQHTRLHLAASGEVVLAGIQTRNLRPTPAEAPAEDAPSRSREHERFFESSEPDFRLACQLHSAANAVAQVLTVAELIDRELRFTTRVDYTVKHGELRHVRLRLRNWDEEKIELQAENVVLWPGQRRSTGERSWLLPLKPGIRGHYQVTLHGSIPLDRAEVGVPMPEVFVEDVERADSYVAVIGSELAGQAKGALQSVASLRGDVGTSWPKMAERIEQKGGRTWRVTGSDWQLRILPRARGWEPTPLRVYLAEQSSAIVDGKLWMHDARYWIRHETHADLQVVFPTSVRILSSSVNGAEVAPLQTGSARIWLPLPGRPGVHCIRLRWLYDRQESLDRPLLTPPQLADAIRGTVLNSVWVPPGWHAPVGTPAGSLGEGATREAALALWRADALSSIIQDLAKQQAESGVSTSLAAAQQSFELYCRHARRALDQGADPSAVTGPQEENLIGWLKDLQAKTRLVPLAPRMVNSETASTALDFGFPSADQDSHSGIPLTWRVQPGAEPLNLQLEARAVEQTHETLAASGQWLGFLAVVWVLAFFPLMLARLRFFWPEQIALVGFLGWYLTGITTIVAGLLLLAVSARIVLLIRRLRALIREHRRRSNSGMAADASAADGPVLS